MPLSNRVDPFGELFADPARGLFFGNRGGRFHRDDRSLGSRRHVSRAWICCRLAFKGRQREVWGKGYTEIVLPRRADRALRRASSVLRVPAAGRGGLRRSLGAGQQVAGTAQSRRNGRSAARRAARRTHEAPAPAPDRRSPGRNFRCSGWRRLGGSRRFAAALDAVWLYRSQAAAAFSHGQRADAAVRNCSAVRGLRTALASQCPMSRQRDAWAGCHLLLQGHGWMAAGANKELGPYSPRPMNLSAISCDQNERYCRSIHGGRNVIRKTVIAIAVVASAGCGVGFTSRYACGGGPTDR